MHRWLFCLAGALGACGGEQATAPAPKAAEPVVEPTVQGGELALAMGDPAQAIRVLERIGADDPMAAYAQDLLREARAELETVVGHLFKEVDTLIDTGQLETARRHLDYIETLGELSASQRAELQARRNHLRDHAAEALARLQSTDQLAKDYLLQNDVDGALRVLRAAQPAALEIAPELARRWIGLIKTAEVRKSALASEGGTPRPRRRHATRPAPTADVATPPAPSEPPPPSAEELARLAQLKEAATARERGAHFEAIVAYREVLSGDPGNGAAKSALKELEAKRQDLVKTLLDKANRYFLRQDLAGAAPYYRRVLQIEPDNERAREGLRMHENLERIRQERKGKP